MPTCKKCAGKASCKQGVYYCKRCGYWGGLVADRSGTTITPPDYTTTCETHVLSGYTPKLRGITNAET